MNKENPVLQRDQIKRPSFHKLVNSTSNGLSSPFPFMEFGLNTQSSLNNVLNHISGKNGNSNKLISIKIDNQDSEICNYTDSFVKPLSIDRLKSAYSLNKEINFNSMQYGHSFIKFPPNDLRNNDFSANYFLKIQSTRKDCAENSQKKTNDFVKKADFVNHLGVNNKIFGESQPITSNLNSQNPITINGFIKNGTQYPEFENISKYGNGNHLFRPHTAGPVFKVVKDTSNNPVSSIEGQPVSKFYVKSYKADALIYNPNNKISPTVGTDKNNNSNLNTPSKTINSPNLYQQVKQEVEEYRKQRRKESMLDIQIRPEIKSISADELYSKNEDLKSLEIIENISSNPQISDSKQNISSNCSNQEPVKEIRLRKESVTNKIHIRPKSVTFNDKVESRDFFDYSSSESEDEDTNENSSTDNDSHGSVVSTESESMSNDQDSVRKYSYCSESFSKESASIIPNLNISVLGNTNESLETIDPNEKVPIDEVDSNSFSSDNASEIEQSTPCNIESKRSSIVHSHKQSADVPLKENSEPKTRLIAATSIGSIASYSSQSTRSNSVLSKSPSNEENQIKKSIQSSKVRAPNLLFKRDLLEMTVYKETKNHLPLIFSKFPNVPPVINFVGDGEKIEQLPWQLRKLLRWRTSLLTPLIVKQTITRSGFRPSRFTCSSDDLDTAESNDWILYFGKHMKGPVFQSIKEYQKVNHFPGSFQLGRKDRLWRNIYRMQQEIGTHEFDFIPQTFCLPTDLELFKECWESGGAKHKWIIKPPASARGIGVKVVYRWNQIPKRRPIIVQRYISNPYLINDSKFDLRLYVFITDINPLKIYLYDDGLVRFASTKYSNSIKSLQNRFVHLTNYSINKLNIEYLDNNDNDACRGHKWSLKSLWNYLKKRGVNTDNVWHRIKDLVIKTIISAEEAINASVNLYCKSTYSIQELFGFDVILDENLKPWILEVNVSPSLHSDSPLDIFVKGGMIKDMFNLSGFFLPEPEDIETTGNGKPKSSNQSSPSSDVYIDRRFWLYEPSADEIEKMKYFVSIATNGTEFKFDPSYNLSNDILDCLTPKDIRWLVQCYDENERKGHFERIYPLSSISSSKKYLSYFERIHYSNLLISSFLTKYSRNNQGIRLIETLCQKKLHLLSAQNGDKIDSKHIWKPQSST